MALIGSAKAWPLAAAKRLEFFLAVLRAPVSQLAPRVLGTGTQGLSICPLPSHPACAPPTQVGL